MRGILLSPFDESTEELESVNDQIQADEKAFGSRCSFCHQFWPRATRDFSQ
jgi:hypothetical protein